MGLAFSVFHEWEGLWNVERCLKKLLSSLRNLDLRLYRQSTGLLLCAILECSCL